MERFAGAGTPISEDGLQQVAKLVGCPEASLWALLAVETAGCGFQNDRRPKILFERHIFNHLTNGKFDARDPDVSAPTAGGYGAGGAHQYLRLQAAIQLNEEAALMSASWGLGQILGTNFKTAGYSDIHAMVDAFVASEDAQLKGMAVFIVNSNLSSAIVRKHWATYARLYNGPAYAKNRYDERLQASCAQFEDRGCPNVQLRAAQVLLNYLGFDTGGIDGIDGKRTNAALKSFQESAGLKTTTAADSATLQALIARVQKL